MSPQSSQFMCHASNGVAQGRRTHTDALSYLAAMLICGPPRLFSGLRTRERIAGCGSNSSLDQTLHLTLNRTSERRKANTPMPEHKHVPAYTHLWLIIQGCDSGTKTSKTLCGGHSGNEWNVCVQMKGKEKQLDYGSINAIIELLFRNWGGFRDY